MSTPPDGQSQKVLPGLTARRRAAELLHSVVDQRRPLNDAFDDHKLDDHPRTDSDRAFTHTLVMTALRRLPTLDAAIDQCLERQLPKDSGRTRAILRIMAAQLLLLDTPAHAAVALAVEDAGSDAQSRKFKNLVNAVGRRIAREEAVLLGKAPAMDLPEWLQQRWTETFGRKRTTKIATALHDQPPIDLTMKPDAPIEELTQQLATHSARQIHRSTVRLRKPGAITKLPGFAEGHWWVQDIAASLPAKILLDALSAPHRAHVLDLCAAPGGKTAQLAAAGATVTALDQSAPRMERLRENMDRLGLSVACEIGDALNYAPDSLFDAVLLDAPCSATGTLRRNPDIAFVRQPADISGVAKLQTKLLKTAASFVKPGGILVYATCSLEPEEGSQQIASFLDSHSEWSLDEIDPASVPQSTRMPDGTLRTLPNMHPLKEDKTVQSGMDGFYAARLRKAGKTADYSHTE